MQTTTLSEKQREEHGRWIKHFEENYDFKFLKPSYETVPYVSQIFENEKAKNHLEKLEYYLLGTYPIEMGTNNHLEIHSLRQKFSKEEYNWHQRHNKLGTSSWGSFAGIRLGILNLHLGRDDLRIEPFPNTINILQCLL